MDGVAVGMLVGDILLDGVGDPVTPIVRVHADALETPPLLSVSVRNAEKLPP